MAERWSNTRAGFAGAVFGALGGPFMAFSAALIKSVALGDWSSWRDSGGTLGMSVGALVFVAPFGLVAGFAGAFLLRFAAARVSSVTLVVVALAFGFVCGVFPSLYFRITPFWWFGMVGGVTAGTFAFYFRSRLSNGESRIEELRTVAGN